MASLPARAIARYPRFSLYNSPYPAHDDGRAVDLYPDRADDLAPAPVAGEVVETRTVRCPSKPYAVDRDHLIALRTPDRLVRVLHVDPAVGPGDAVAVGDPLGETVRSGFFAPWVANHLHVGVRPPDADPVRASGSLRLALDAPVEAVPWDGTGTVVERGDTYVVLDAPAHPAPGERFAAVGSDEGVPLDGGLPHYAGGGALGHEGEGTVSLLGTPVGDADGRDVAWRDVTVRANGTPIHGLSLFCGRDRLGVKLVARDWTAAAGEAVRVAIGES